MRKLISSISVAVALLTGNLVPGKYTLTLIPGARRVDRAYMIPVRWMTNPELPRDRRRRSQLNNGDGLCLLVLF